MKIGQMTWGIALFGALMALTMAMAQQPALTAETIDDVVVLRGPSQGLMIATNWASGNCCCDAAHGVSLSERSSCEATGGQCVARGSCEAARQALMSDQALARSGLSTGPLQ